MKDQERNKDRDLPLAGDDRYVSDLVHTLCNAQPGLTDPPRMQDALNEFLGLKEGSRYRQKLTGALEQCWYAFAADNGDGWHHNGNAALIDIDKLLGCTKNERHINHCCALGLRYKEDRPIEQ